MAVAKGDSGDSPGGFYGLMSRYPLIFLVFWPAVLLAIAFVGLTKDDLVEDEVGNIWVPTSGSFYKDKEYEDSVRADYTGASSFLGITVSRDEGNLLTESRLQEIIDRMNAIMDTEVEHNGKTYKYADICYSNNAGLGTTYEFPCLRISPMDLFREVQSSHSTQDKLTWYEKIAKDSLVNPLIPRFGTAQNFCTQDGLASVSGDCDLMFALRSSDLTVPGPPLSASQIRAFYGFPADYESSLSLFSDIGNLEPAEACSKCIEAQNSQNIEDHRNMMWALFGPDFPVVDPNTGVVQVTLADGMLGLAYALCAAGTFNSGTTTYSQADCAQKLAEIQKVSAKGMPSHQDAADFLFYFTTRGLYTELGIEGLIGAWNNLTVQEGFAGSYAATAAIAAGSGGALFAVDGTSASYATDPANVAGTYTALDATTAKVWLANHADAPFSSARVGGSPLPIFSDNGKAFELGTSGSLPADSPVGGSGVDLTGTPGSAITQFTDSNSGWMQNVGGVGAANDKVPGDATWLAAIEGDPVVKWVIAGVTDDTTNFINNGDVPIDATLKATLNGADGKGDEFQASLNNPDASFLGTNYTLPDAWESPDLSGDTTKQDLARAWYNLLIDSNNFLKITQGVSNPYTWTTGQGCGLAFRGERPEFTGKTEAEILEAASNFIYYVDEGESLGAIDPNLVVGGSTPGASDYNAFTDKLTKVTALQHIYPILRPKGLVERVRNCNRPATSGGPIDITEGEAEQVLLKWKEKFEKAWSAGWDDNSAGDVQFVGFFDDAGVVGTTGRMLEEITLGGTTLMIISYVVTIACSVIFLFSSNLVASKTALTFFGALLVILAFFAALGATSLFGISLNITMGWTLPFIMVGLGMDDMYIILLALKNNGGYDSNTFVHTMKEVIVPVTMTSMVNASMFAIMHMSDIPAVYQTATTALLAVAALYISMLTTFPAFCWMDMKRQAGGKKDWLCCLGGDAEKVPQSSPGESKQGWLFKTVYEPLMLTEGPLRTIFHLFVVIVTIAVAAVSAYGCTEFKVGVGIEDLFPSDSQGGQYATSRTKYLGSWPININWGDIDYTSGAVQMKMAEQFEKVIATSHVSDTETGDLWIADFATWTTNYCTANFNPETLGVKECGKDLTYPGTEGGTCEGSFMENTLSLRNKNINFVEDYEPPEACSPNSGGYCIAGDKMHSDDVANLANVQRSGSDAINAATSSWCPVAVTLNPTTGVYTSWSNAKFKWCVEKWQNYTGGGGSLEVVADTATAYADCAGDYLNDDELKVNSDGAIPVSSGPGFFGVGLQTHEDTVDLIKETRKFCDEDPDLRCWMDGIAYDYWEQYVNIKSFLFELIAVGVAVGFVVATCFLAIDLMARNEAGHSSGKLFVAAIAGGLLITIVTILSVLTVVGISTLLDVNLTAFSVMSYILSVGFAVEYSVHITHRFLTAPLNLPSASQRVAFAMDYLFLPCYMAFISSTVGIVCLVFSEFTFIDVFFFRPLMVVMFATYFFGCFFLPVLLSKLNLNILKVGPKVHRLSVVEGGEQSSSKLEPAL